ncbi:MAG: NupC/NupG family nucleoside CNT transporter [Planctomycetota bacterium]
MSDGSDTMKYNLISGVGMICILGIAWVLSADRRRMNWRVIGWGVGLQLLFGALIFRLPQGRALFLKVNSGVNALLRPAKESAAFVFGSLAKDEGPAGFILAFNALPTIIYVSALMAVLYYLGILPLLIRAFSFVFTKLMRLSGAETLCAAANIFAGVESATTVKGYLSTMTRSELCTVLTTGMATIAGSVLGLYCFALGGVLPQIAGHLVSASILSAPAALMLSKILLPELETPQTLGQVVAPERSEDESLFGAVVEGANTGLKLVFGVVALLLAMLGLVYLINLLLGLVHSGASLEAAFGFVFRGFAYLMGVPGEDTKLVGTILGERPIKTEVGSYFHLAAAIKDGLLKHPRSAIITAYALCGFAHFASVAIFVGGIAAIVPERKKDLTSVAWRAFIAATLACFITACVAGLFFTDAMASTVLLGGGK